MPRSQKGRSTTTTTTAGAGAGALWNMHGREKHFQQQGAATVAIPKQPQPQQAKTGAFITGRSPGSINIFDVGTNESESGGSKSLPVVVGSKHYKHLKAVHENEGILKARELVGAKLAVKTDRAGLKKLHGGGKSKGFNALSKGNEEPVFAIDKKDPNYVSDEDDILREYRDTVASSSSSSSSSYVAQPLITTTTAAAAAKLAKQAHYVGGSPPRHDYDAALALGSARTVAASASKLTFQEFKIRVVDLLMEYSVSEDMNEFLRSLSDLRCGIWNYEMVRRAISFAMEHNPRERELVSRLLSNLKQRGVISMEDAGKGFERLFELADDLSLDIPQAKDYLARFLARAIADEVLPLSFLVDPLVVRMGGDIVKQTKSFLTTKQSTDRLEHIWGANGDVVPVEELKKLISLFLREYVSSGDLEEAADCVKSLNVPHFHHELVKRVVTLGIENDEKVQKMLSKLLSYLSSRYILTSPQLLDGYSQCVKTMKAEPTLKVFIMQSVADGNLTAKDAASLFA